MEPSRAAGLRLEWVASFVAVAREGGFSAAAKSLYRSQPRVSTHVAELEHALGARLFDRTVQPVALTPEGRALLPHAEEVLARMTLFAEVTSGAQGPLRGEVRLGAYPSAAAFLFPPAVRRLAQTHPSLSLVLREGPSLALGTSLSHGEVDLAIRPVLPLVSDDRLASTVLWQEPLVAVMPLDATRPSKPMTLRELASQPLVTIGETGAGGRQFETNLAFAQAGLAPTIAFQTNQPQTLVSIVRHGLGVGVTNALAMTTANLDGVALAPIVDVPMTRQVALWWRTDTPPSPAAAAVREVLTSLPVPRWPWERDGGAPA